MCDFEEMVVVEIEERTLQNGRQCQIVFRQGQEVAEDDQILNCDLIRQPDAV